MFESGNLSTEDRAKAIADGTITGPEYHECPMCGKSIRKRAQECQFCGERFAAPGGLDEGPEIGVWREGNLLVMHKKARLPGRCVKSNAPAETWLRREVHWHPAWLNFLILPFPLIYVLVALFFRQSAVIQIG